MNWISVSERLPELETEVLVKHNEEWINSDYLVCKLSIDPYETKKSFYDVYDMSFIDSVTHWLPITPPKEDL